MIQHDDPLRPLVRLPQDRAGAEKPGRPGAKNDCINLFHGGPIELRRESHKIFPFCLLHPPVGLARYASTSWGVAKW